MNRFLQLSVSICCMAAAETREQGLREGRPGLGWPQGADPGTHLTVTLKKNRFFFFFFNYRSNSSLKD